MTDETTTGLRKLDADVIRSLLDEIEAKDAEIAAMRPVVMAAVAWGQDKIVFHRLDDALLTAVRAYEAKMKEVGDA